MRDVRRTVCVVGAALAALAVVGAAAAGSSEPAATPADLDRLLNDARNAYGRGDAALARQRLRAAQWAIAADPFHRKLIRAGSLYDEGEPRKARGELKRAIRILNPWFWVVLGLIGQVSFTARFVVQWLASERKGESVIPLAFWYFSLGGSTLLLIYAIWRQDPVFILGLSLTSFVYIRNLMLIFRKRAREAGSAEAGGATQ